MWRAAPTLPPPNTTSVTIGSYLKSQCRIWGRCPDRGGGGQLARGEYHLVIRIIAIPASDQFFGGLADVLTVADAAGEHARDIQPVGTEEKECPQTRQKNI